MMNMKTPVSELLVCVEDTNACVKIAGRACFNSSVDFKKLINGLSQKGCSRFVLDLTDCPVMDSTFLGVLAGLGWKFDATPNGDPHPTIELLNPKPRIIDLLDNLGVSHLFKVLNRQETTNGRMEPVAPASACADRKEVSRTCLEAHQTLMDINPANVPKFKDVAKFLAEDLKKMEEGEKGENGNGKPADGK